MKNRAINRKKGFSGSGKSSLVTTKSGRVRKKNSKEKVEFYSAKLGRVFKYDPNKHKRGKDGRFVETPDAPKEAGRPKKAAQSAPVSLAKAKDTLNTKVAKSLSLSNPVLPPGTNVYQAYEEQQKLNFRASETSRTTSSGSKEVEGSVVDKVKQQQLELTISQRLAFNSLYDKAPEVIKQVVGRVGLAPVAEADLKVSAHYNLKEGHIQMDSLSPQSGSFKPIAAHEHGHYLDHRLATKGLYSGSRKFSSAMELDRVHMENNRAAVEKAMEALAKEYPDYHIIARDILSATTSGKIGGFTHSAEYWSKSGTRGAEVFANMHSLFSSGDTRLGQFAQAVAPNTTRDYAQKMKRVADGSDSTTSVKTKVSAPVRAPGKLLTARTALAKAKDSFDERSAAAKDKKEPKSTPTAAKKKQEQQEFTRAQEAAFPRVHSNSPAFVQQVVDRAGYPVLALAVFSDGAYFSRRDGIIQMSLISPSLGMFDAYAAHEYGHYLDERIGSGDSVYFSSGNGFKRTVAADAEHMATQKTEIKEALAVIAKQQPEYHASARDILSGATNGKMGGFTHSKEYWSVEGNRETEVFANIHSFYASNDPLLIAFAERFAPASAALYKNKMERIASGEDRVIATTASKKASRAKSKNKKA